MAAVCMENPVANISGSTISDPGAMDVDSSSCQTRARVAVLSSQTLAGWQRMACMARGQRVGKKKE